MPFNPKFTITQKINKALVEIERVRGFLDAVKLKEDWFSEMQNDALIQESHYSTHIEGTTLTLEQATSIIEGKKVAGIKNDDARELLNYKKTMVFISKYLGKDTPIEEKTIQDLHRILVKGVRGSLALPGKYRNIQNYVVNSKTREVVYTPPLAKEVPKLMAEYIKWLNNIQDISPVLAAGIAQFQFVHIHPFLDGNGRTARILSTLILYKTGYDFKRLFTISEYYDKNRPAYYYSIQAVRSNKMDMTIWLEYFVEGLRSQMLEVQEKGKLIIKAEKVAKTLVEYNLNNREEKIIRYLIVNERTDNEIVQKICKSIRRTATRDLKKLIDLKLLVSRGKLKGTYYVLAKNIKEKI